MRQPQPADGRIAVAGERDRDGWIDLGGVLGDAVHDEARVVVAPAVPLEQLLAERWGGEDWEIILKSTRVLVVGGVPIFGNGALDRAAGRLIQNRVGLRLDAGARIGRDADVVGRHCGWLNEQLWPEMREKCKCSDVG